MPRKRTAPSQQPEYVREYVRARYEITGNRFIKDWRARNPEKKREYNARWYRNHPEKRKAHDAVHAAVVRGVIRPATAFRCVDCGQAAHEYDHHLGYEPEHRLNVQPVCRPCHGKRRRLP